MSYFLNKKDLYLELLSTLYNLKACLKIIRNFTSMILVIGGTGLLGSNLLAHLVNDADELIATYQSESKIAKVKKNFNFYHGAQADALFQKITWKKVDILDLVELNDVFQNVNEVYHCAAQVSFRRRDFNLLMRINGQGTANVVNVCLSSTIQKLCYVSSTAAVGKVFQNGKYHVVESNKWTQNDKTSGYAISKYTAEKEVWRGIEEGLNAVIINPSVIIGPGSWEESSLTIFRTIQNGLRFYTKGANAFVDVRDVCNAMIRLMQSEIQSERFLCTGNNSSFRELLSLIANKLNKKAPNLYANRIMCEIAWRLASLKALFFGNATLTKESTESSQTVVEYDAAKIKKELNISFISLEDAVDFAIKGRIQ
jgi:dihydroflavonol-4-reductase